MTGRLRAGSGPLFTIARTYYSANCGDVRDKIYVVHSLATVCCKEAVQVDYTSSSYALCGRLLEHHISSHDETKVPSEIFAYSKELHKRLKCISPSPIDLGDLISGVPNPCNSTTFTVYCYPFLSIATSSNPISDMFHNGRIWLSGSLRNLSSAVPWGTD